MAVGIHGLKAANSRADPLVLTTAGSVSIAQVLEIRNLEQHQYVFARAGATGSWVAIPPRMSINIPIPAGADTNLHLATTGKPYRRFITADTSLLAPEAPVRVLVSAVEIISV